MTLGTVLIGIVLALMVGLIVLLLSKKRWYMVYTATPETLVLSRTMMEWEVSGTIIFRDERKRKVIIPKRWILKIVEITKEDADTALEEMEKAG